MTRWHSRIAGVTFALLPGAALAQDTTAFSFIGVEKCIMCHKSEKSGNQAAVWKQSRHAEAYNTLLTPRADSIAKSRGFATPAKDAAECLACHTMASSKIEDQKLGVQCEACHGPGSAYKSLAVMKDKAKAIAAGLTRYEDKAAIEKQCRSCHNEKSPSFKAFNFDERWAQIKHPKPAA